MIWGQFNIENQVYFGESLYKFLLQASNFTRALCWSQKRTLVINYFIELVPGLLHIF